MSQQTVMSANISFDSGQLSRARWDPSGLGHKLPDHDQIRPTRVWTLDRFLKFSLSREEKWIRLLPSDNLNMPRSKVRIPNSHRSIYMPDTRNTRNIRASVWQWLVSLLTNASIWREQFHRGHACNERYNRMMLDPRAIVCAGTCKLFWSDTSDYPTLGDVDRHSFHRTELNLLLETWNRHSHFVSLTPTFTLSHNAIVDRVECTSGREMVSPPPCDATIHRPLVLLILDASIGHR